METDLGRIVFVKRELSRLDVERAETSLTAGWVTTSELSMPSHPGWIGSWYNDWRMNSTIRRIWRAAVELAGRAHA